MTDWTRATRRAAELCHLRQQCATLAGDNTQLREQVALQAARIAELEDALRLALEGKEFYYRQYRDRCKEVQR